LSSETKRPQIEGFLPVEPSSTTSKSRSIKAGFQMRLFLVATRPERLAKIQLLLVLPDHASAKPEATTA